MMVGLVLAVTLTPASALSAQSPTAQVESEAGIGQFRGGATHPGRADGPGPATLGGVAWRFRTEGPVRASPVVLGDRVFIGGGDHRFYALDAATGAELWRYEVGAEVAGAAAVTSDRVVFTDRYNTVHALDPSSGAAVWTRRGGDDLPLPWGHEGWDYLLASPTVIGDRVLAGTGDGVLRAMSLLDGRELWRFPTGGRIRSAPAVHGGVVYVGSGDGVVYGVDFQDGSEVWRFETEGAAWESAEFGFDRQQIYSSPAIEEGILYIGSRDAADYAVDLSTGGEVWSYRDGTPWVIASPAVGPERIYTARSSGGAVMALDRRTGEPVWQAATGGLVFSSPLLADGVVYVGSGDGSVYAFDAATGEVRWRYRTEGGVMSTPVLWNEHLIFGSEDGAVYALRPGSSTPRRAVYWDNALAEGSIWGGVAAHRQAAEYFQSRGYDSLDATGLVKFLERASDDRAESPSVVVVAMDRVPNEVLTGRDASLLRRYLDAGGKVVWMGALPGVLARNEEGAITGVDREGASGLLGVDVSGWDTDEHWHRPTEEGRRWGLVDGWMGWPGGVSGAEGLVALAEDDLGRAGMWVRSYGGPEGTGFVLARPSEQRSVLRQLREVAEYGVLTDVR